MISRKLVLFTQAALVAVLAIQARAAGADEIAQGRDIYNSYCQGCHGAEAAGLAAFGGDLAAFRQRLVGTDNMPDMSGVVTEAEAAELFAFLASRRPPE